MAIDSMARGTGGESTWTGVLRALQRAAAMALVVGAVGVGCGGPARPAEGGGGGPEGEATERPVVVKPTALDCSDGTCFACGDGGICLVGQFCNEAQGTCSQVHECAERASCACVEPIVGGACSCEEREGGVYVSCG